jgi:hypothetical protein
MINWRFYTNLWVDAIYLSCIAHENIVSELNIHAPLAIRVVTNDIFKYKLFQPLFRLSYVKNQEKFSPQRTQRFLRL